MKQRLFIFLGCLVLPAFAFAQKDKAGNKFVIVAGKPMTSTDSLMVRQLFFSAMREKTIENLGQASEMFNQVLQVDPQNDASMYELANLKKVQNKYADARDLLERAVTVNPDNEWYWVGLADCYEKSNDIGKLENVFNELIRIDPDNQSIILIRQMFISSKRNMMKPLRFTSSWSR